MGMDMLIAIAKEPRMTPAAKAWCDSLELGPEGLVKIEQGVLLARVSRLEISESDLEHLEHLLEVGAEETAAEPALRALLELAVTTLAEGRRDVSSLFLHNTWWMVSGGPSWGDSPTDAYDLLCAVDAMGVTGRAMSVREVKAAHAAMVSA